MYRSDIQNCPSERDIAFLKERNISTIIDVRGEDEIPVKSVKKANNSIFPVQEYDWDDIRARIKPLISKVIGAISK